MIRLLIAAIIGLLIASAAASTATYLPTISGFTTVTTDENQTPPSTPTVTSTEGTPTNATATSAATSTPTPTPTLTPTSTDSAGKSNTPTPTSTPTSTSVPSPYNVQAQDIALQLADMASEFHLDSSEVLTLSTQAVSWGAVSAYRTRFLSDAAQPSGPTKVQSAVVVFRDKSGAGNAFAAEIVYSQHVPGYTQIPVSTHGDASEAFRATGTLNGQPANTYYVFAYQGNVWAAILINGPADVTELADAESYVDIVLGKLH
jgi:hypothetical protein